ncbi:MAG: hypothetical protein CTY35_04775 [Methylotenera sp.]|nr:MAG: hypothetical protein CTY38_07750 [Methylotenera sp.]PPC98860.1 MAG: hypothetical protein CTY35_04775 [Methylotenera sp.]
MIKNKTLPDPRIAQLESLLLWEGRLNNARLRELFDLKGVRASEWIRAFREQRPDWCNWDTVTKSFHATDEAYRHGPSTDNGGYGTTTSLAQYLALVGIPHTSFESSLNPRAWAAFSDISVPRPRIYATISEAIRLRTGVEITYMSMREPKPHLRIIYPHSLIQAGRRWHTRAYSIENQQFRDYALGRIVSAKLCDDISAKNEKDDEAWMANVRVRLVAHPDLNPDQENMIRFEYFGKTAARVDTCRGALVNYYIYDIRAAIDTATQKPPEYQLAVANVDEIKKWLFPLK